MRKKKLFQYSAPDFKVFKLLQENGKVQTHTAGKIPLPLWPDDRWCFDVAAYLNAQVGKKLSVKDRGGTIATYMYALSPIIRFCYQNSVPFASLDDNRFKQFIVGLSEEQYVKDGVRENKRNNRSIVNIATRTLDFLSFVGKLHRKLNFVGPNGSINAVQKLHIPRDENGEPVGPPRLYWHHDCFPERSPEKRRHPVSDDYIKKMRNAVMALGGSTVLRRRRLVLLRLLEKTGARRIEVASITVSAVYAAKAMTKPLLEVETAKQGNEESKRLVPMQHVDLDYLIEYIRFYRHTAVKKLKKDHGILLVNERTGARLTPNFISVELYNLKKAAGIKGKAHPHLFRHRYITTLLIRFIQEHQIENRHDFVKLLQNASRYKQEILNYTGQRSMRALNRYIDWAFFKLSSYNDILHKTGLVDLAESMAASLLDLEIQKASMSSEEFAQRALDLMHSFTQDLTRER